MVEYVTRDQLIEIGRVNLTEGRLKVTRAENRNPNGSTFLSHSSKDDEVMPAVVTILENHGARVYLDKKDHTLSTKPVREIATSLRNNISAASKFVIFASDNIKSSRWVPWELGLADGFKRSQNVAVFPAPANQYDTEWTEQEYLGVYDRVVWGKFTGQTQYQWLVWNQTNNTAIFLRDWITR